MVVVVVEVADTVDGGGFGLAVAPPVMVLMVPAVGVVHAGTAGKISFDFSIEYSNEYVHFLLLL